MFRFFCTVAMLICLSGFARAGWEVDFELNSDLFANESSGSELPDDAANPLSASWNMKGVEQNAIVNTRYFRRDERVVSTKPIVNSEVFQITAGSWPLTPRREEQPAVPPTAREAIVDVLWPTTRNYLMHGDLSGVTWEGAHARTYLFMR